MKEGPQGGALTFLTAEQMQRIHEASLRLLEDHGLRCESRLIFDLFRSGGALVDAETRMVRVPRDMVSQSLQTTPHSFVLCGRDPRMDLLIENNRVYYGMGGSAEPFFWDWRLQMPREPTKSDMVAATRVADALPCVDFVMSLCSAGDVPSLVHYFHEYDAMFRNTTKPIVYSAPSQRDAVHILEMAAAVSGGEVELRRRPNILLMAQPVSPLTVGEYMDGMVEFARAGVPVLSSPGPMMAATSPASLAGTLVQINAEALFGVVLVQLVQPGAAVGYAPHTATMDVKTTRCTYGGTEQSVARAAVAQLGRFYGLPSFGLGGGSDAKCPDAQAAAEVMQGMLLNGLAGLTLTQTLGTMAGGMYGSLEMVVICNEIAAMVKRVLAGIRVDEETLAEDVIRRVGAGGHYLDQEHTTRMYRGEFYIPNLFDRSGIDDWREAGAKSIDHVAREKVQHILAEHHAPPLPDAASQDLKLALARAERAFLA